MSQSEPFQTTQNEKLDPFLLLEIDKIKKSSQPNQIIDVLIRTNNKINSAEKTKIEKRGAKIGSVTGDILTAAIPASSVRSLSNLAFIIYIEKPRKLHLKPND